MNIFGFRPFKGRFNLGNSDDIPTNDDGTLIGAIKQINTHLTANSNELVADYQDGKYGFTIDGLFYALTSGSGGGGAPDFSNPIAISSGTAVSEDCIVFICPNVPAGNNQSRDNIWFKVNGNSVYYSINLLAATYYYITVTGGGALQIQLKAGDVPTWSNMLVYGFKLL